MKYERENKNSDNHLFEKANSFNYLGYTVTVTIEI
jgi:hypothetical protein